MPSNNLRRPLPPKKLATSHGHLSGTMSRQQIVVRKSPFVFLRWLVAVEFLFAMLPFLVAVLTGLRAKYETTDLGGSVPYPLLVAVVAAALQALIIALFFTAWYFATYYLDRERLTYSRGPLFENKLLVPTPTISAVQIQHGPLGQRLDYGSLVISSWELQDQAWIRDIPNPAQYAKIIQDLVEPVLAIPSPSPGPGSLAELIAGGENQFVEFKSSLMWDYHRRMANKDLYEPVMKNVAAFMNAGGGTVIVGVADDGEILGLEKDYQALRKNNVDGWENAFTMAFNSMVGVEYHRFIDLDFPQVDGRTICVIGVHAADEPVFLTFKGNETFYIRAGNSTQPLTISKATRYIQTRFAV